MVLQGFLREKIEEEYLNIAKNIFPSRQERFPAEVFTKERFLWAYAVLLSRSFRLRVLGERRRRAWWVGGGHHTHENKEEHRTASLDCRPRQTPLALPQLIGQYDSPRQVVFGQVS